MRWRCYRNFALNDVKIKSKTQIVIILAILPEACNEWRDHLRGLAPGQHSSDETSLRWRAVGDNTSSLTDLEIELHSNVIKQLSLPAGRSKYSSVFF